MGVLGSVYIGGIKIVTNNSHVLKETFVFGLVSIPLVFRELDMIWRTPF